MHCSLYNTLKNAGLNVNSDFSFALSNTGQILPLSDQETSLQVINSQNIKALDLATSILAQKINPDIDFSLQTEDDNSVTVNTSDKKFTNVLQAFFDENPEIVKDFQRSQALAAIDDARKSLQLSPSEMKTRLQLESMMSWWDTSQNSNTSTFGTYTSGTFAQLSGINLSV